uniref:Uncharacterized protein n=1 Tax=Lepeophtheirus salmonis TaxID=72036 RepID=A0A0K2VCQ1_LEPSM
MARKALIVGCNVLLRIRSYKLKKSSSLFKNRCFSICIT